MTSTQTAGLLLIAGSTIFGVGAAIGVPQVFREADPEVRLRVLEDRLAAWRLAQPFYALGPLVATAGVALLVDDAATLWEAIATAVAFSAMLIGAVAWAWSVYVRATRVREFALRTLPGWPIVAYVILTGVGLALLGVGLLSGGAPEWLGWLTIAASCAFLAIYMAFKDIPPFVFYLLLTVVGVALL